MGQGQQSWLLCACPHTAATKRSTHPWQPCPPPHAPTPRSRLTHLELQLEAVGGLDALRRAHDACIADEQVQGAAAGAPALHKLAHAGEGGQV